MLIPSDQPILDILQHGSITLEGEFVQGFNYTFLAKVTSAQGDSLQTVYKPQQGERPLWDFPNDTLAHREAAAYLVSDALGWQLVPPTIYRADGPFGPGSLQLFIEHDPNYHYFNSSDDDFQRLRPVVLFDLLVNNADRKGSHVIFAPDGVFWLIDHGLCFHVEEKLRTVIWDFAEQPIPAPFKKDLLAFKETLEAPLGLAADLAGHLASEEIAALGARCEQLILLETFPSPPADRRAYPFPPL